MVEEKTQFYVKDSEELAAAKDSLGEGRDKLSVLPAEESLERAPSVATSKTSSKRKDTEKKVN